MVRVGCQSDENARDDLQVALLICTHLCSKTFPPCKLSFIPWLQTQNRPVLEQVLPLCGVQHCFKSMSQSPVSLGGHRSGTINVPLKHTPQSQSLLGWSTTEEDKGERWTTDFWISVSFLEAVFL